MTAAFHRTGEPFGKTALLISTGDGITARRSKNAFMEAGFPQEAINLDAIASEKAYFRDDTKVSSSFVCMSFEKNKETKLVRPVPPPKTAMGHRSVRCIRYPVSCLFAHQSY